MPEQLHPIFASLLDTIKNQPLQIKRADYVARLVRMDWEFERADDARWYRAGRDELRALQAMRSEVDPTGSLWNRHAPESYRIKETA